MTITVDAVALLPHCRDCRFWDQESYHVVNNVGYCALTRWGDRGADSNPHPDTTKARAQGEDGWSALLETDADFGCVQWQKRKGA